MLRRARDADDRAARRPKSCCAAAALETVAPLPRGLLDNLDDLADCRRATAGAPGDRRPFRRPQASMAVLVGGDTNVRPGEVSMAHTGVLFLDKLSVPLEVVLKRAK